MVDRITGPIEIINATLSGSNTYFPSGSVNNAAFSSNITDRLAATKADHQKHIIWKTDTDSTTVADHEEILHIAQGDGVIVAAFVANETAPTGGDLDYTVDIKMTTNGSGAYTTILSSPITSPADNTVVSGTLSQTTYSQYSRFLLDINTSGSTGTNGIGVTVCLILNEEPS